MVTSGGVATSTGFGGNITGFAGNIKSVLVATSVRFTQ
jgi:hypothetical protein